MELKLENLKNSVFENKNINLPKFDVEKLRKKTIDNPSWIHFGGGNIFRIFVADALQQAIENGKTDTGVIVAESYDEEIINRYYEKNDFLSLSVIMKSDGTLNKKIIASIADAMDVTTNSDGFSKLKEIAKMPSLRMISYTITEKGYALKDFQGKYFSFVQKDLDAGPENPTHSMAILTALIYERYKAGKLKLAVVSMDNCSHNGDKIAAAVKDIANAWCEKGFVDKDFIDYVCDEKYISFPLTMIDKITPRPSYEVSKKLEADGFENMDLIVTDKKSFTAPFVNAEECEYLIIEDKFPNGKIDISRENVIFTDRDTVNNVETMKVTTCLNPLHTALAVTGCLLGYNSIAQEMKDETLLRLIKKIGYDEGMKVVVDPKIIDPEKFIDEVINERFVNPNIPDTPQRIAMDTSQKMGIRFGITIEKYSQDKELDVLSLIGIPLAIAGWCRYLVGIDDSGKEFEVSSDPMLEVLLNTFGQLKLGDKTDISHILCNKDIFGVDLLKLGSASRIQEYFDEMLSQIGGVRKTIDKYLEK